MNKKQAAARKANWRRALSEGRVVRYTTWDAGLNCEQYSMVAYPTKEQAERTLQAQLARISAGESTHISANIAPAVSEEGALTGRPAALS